jgi:hypothetical protein
MERADRDIDELLETLDGTFQRLRGAGWPDMAKAQ